MTPADKASESRPTWPPLEPTATVLRVTTRCGTRDQFVKTFSGFVSATTIFLPGAAPISPRPAQRFVIQLAAGETIMRGIADVEPRDPRSPGGVSLRLVRLGHKSEPVFADLMTYAAATRSSAIEARGFGPTGTHAGDAPAAIAIVPARTVKYTRPPPADLVMPVNPLGGLHDQAIEAFVECVLEEHDDVFPDDE